MASDDAVYFEICDERGKKANTNDKSNASIEHGGFPQFHAGYQTRHEPNRNNHKTCSFGRNKSVIP